MADTMILGKSIQYFQAKMKDHGGIKTFLQAKQWFREQGLSGAWAERAARKAMPDLYNQFMAGQNPRAIQRF